jgi:hypothetical protein
LFQRAISFALERRGQGLAVVVSKFLDRPGRREAAAGHVQTPVRARANEENVMTDCNPDHTAPVTAAKIE